MSLNIENQPSNTSQQPTALLELLSRDPEKTRNPVIRPKSLKTTTKVKLSTIQTPPGSTLPALGPTIQMSLTSRPITLPPRPQPGRKPLQDTHGTKRQEQNRSAQRNFRKRKAENLDQLKIENDEIRREKQELEVRCQSFHLEIERITRETKETVKRLEQQVREHIEMRQNAEKELVRMKGEMDAFRKQVSEQTSISIGTSSKSPLADRGTVSVPATTPTILSSAVSPAPIPTRDCGTCDPKTCLCFAESVNIPETDAPESVEISTAASSDQDLAIDFTTWRAPTSTTTTTTTSTNPQSKNTPQEAQTLAPGTCERCQIDPEQRAYCLGMAQQPPPVPRNKPITYDEMTFDIQPFTKRPRLDSSTSSSSSFSNLNLQHARLAIPCTDAYPLYKQFRPIASSVTEEMLRTEVLRKQMLSSTLRPSNPILNLPPVRITEPSSSSSSSDSKDIVIHTNDGSLTNKDGQKFTAQEVDLCQVLASLHQAGSSSVGSRTSAAGSSGGGSEVSGRTDLGGYSAASTEGGGSGGSEGRRRDGGWA